MDNNVLEEIIGYFNVGFPLIISRVIGYNQETDAVFGSIRFYRDDELLFEMDVADALMFSDIIKRKAQELYDDVIGNVVALASMKGNSGGDDSGRDVI